MKHSNSTAPMPNFNIKQKLYLALSGIFKWNIKSHATATELVTLLKLSKSLGPNATCVEIGSYIGASSLMIAKGLKNSSKLYCIDPWENEAMSEGKWDTFAEFSYNTRSVKDKIIPIRKYSFDAAECINEPIDLLFIDGDHSYESVKKDVQLWLPKLKHGGIILMHDIGWDCGVKPVVEELVIKEVNNVNQLPNLFWATKK